MARSSEADLTSLRWRRIQPWPRWHAAIHRRALAFIAGLIRSWRGARAAFLALLLIVSGCASTPRFNCPPLVAYPPAFQQQVAGEMDGDRPGMEEMIVDYGKMRDACRKGAGIRASRG